MINTDEFASMVEEMEKEDQLREDVIKRARDIIRLSKVVIYSVHRGEADEAKLEEMEKLINELPEPASHVGIREVAVQEFVEAMTLYRFVKEGTLMTREELGVDKQNYLLGICDLTGELMRMAVNRIIGKDYDTVYRIRDMVTAIYGEFLKMNLPNGELRKKSDSIKWNLNKIEDLVLELSLKDGR
jgi:translin